MIRRPVEYAAQVRVEKKIASKSSEEENLISCLEVRTAGDPDDANIVFTDLSPRILSGHLEEMGTRVGRDAIATWLEDAGIRRRQISKDIPGGEHPDRNAQFVIIAAYIEQYESDENPWFSIDTKAKEHQLYRKAAFVAIKHSRHWITTSLPGPMVLLFRTAS